MASGRNFSNANDPLGDAPIPFLIELSTYMQATEVEQSDAPRDVG